MDRSRGFGSHKSKLHPPDPLEEGILAFTTFSTLTPPSLLPLGGILCLGFQLACSYHLQAHYTKGTAFFCLLRYTWFLVLFHSSFAILFNFPSRYSFHYRCMFVFSLRCFVHLSSSFVLMLYSLVPPPIGGGSWYLPHTRLFYSLWFTASHLFFGFWLFWVQFSIFTPIATFIAPGFWLHLFRSPLL